jgi:hypothetical protein
MRGYAPTVSYEEGRGKIEFAIPNGDFHFTLKDDPIKAAAHVSRYIWLHPARPGES